MAADVDGTWGSVMFIPKGAASLKQKQQPTSSHSFLSDPPKARALACSPKPSEAEAPTANLEPTHGVSDVVAPVLAVTPTANIVPSA